jgi:regulatory protein
MEEKFYNLALRFLSFRIRSEKEVRDKLISKKASEDVIDKIIQKLKKYNLINDLEFAKKWIENRNRFKPRSLRLVKMELKQKGIEDEILEAVVNDLEFSVDSDLEQAKKLVEKKIVKFKNLSKQEIYQKLGRYLASKGFNWNIIKKSIDYVYETKRS